MWIGHRCSIHSSPGGSPRRSRLRRTRSGVNVEAVVHELVENDFATRDIPEFGLPESDYGRALDSLVQANVDVIVHTEDGQVLLGYRKDLPLRDMFWVFGGRMHRGETMVDAAVRNLAREVGITADRSRLTADHIYNVRWATRSAPPEEHGFQTLLILMRYACTPDEAASLAVADDTHQWLRWHSAAELHELQRSGSALLHPFLPIILRNAGLF